MAEYICSCNLLPVTDILYVLLVLFQSGTTGSAKGVMLSHDNVSFKLTSALWLKVNPY